MKTVVLLSGGLDSATCLGLTLVQERAEDVIALSVIYGQKHIKELECAKALAAHYGVEHKIIDISDILQFSNCALLQHSDQDIPEKSYAEQLQECGSSRVSTYVPFRNGLMLSAAGSIALSLFPDADKIALVYGAHADDAAGNAYPDCSVSFVNAMGEALREGTGGVVVLFAPFIAVHKATVVSEGLGRGVPYQLTWSCYEGHDKACGKCGTCLDRLEAFKANGVEDPIEYMED